MTKDEIIRARHQVAQWVDYFEENQPRSPTLHILRLVVRYARVLEGRLDERSHTREGWWTRFMKILGD